MCNKVVVVVLEIHVDQQEDLMRLTAGHKRQVQKSDRINSDRQSGSDQLGSTRTNSDRIKK